MADTPLPAVGDRIAEWWLTTDGAEACWTSDLTAAGACVLFVLEHAESPSARVQARSFDALADAFARRGVTLAGLCPDGPDELRALRRAEHITHCTLLADPTGQVCGALGVLNGSGAHRCALILDRDARVRAVVQAASPDGQAAAALDLVEQFWPAAASASASA